MTSATKKFLSLFFVVVALVVAIVWREFNRARQIVITPTNQPLVSRESYNIPIDQTDPVLGNPGAPLLVVAFIDLGDAKSRALTSLLTSFVKAHLKDARLVWKDFPVRHILAPDSNSAHIAAWCAGQQNHFWDFVDGLLGSGRFDENQLLRGARAGGIDIKQWQTCRSNPTAGNHLTESLGLAESLGISSPPGLFVNNKRINVTEDVDLNQMLTSFISK